MKHNNLVITEETRWTQMRKKWGRFSPSLIRCMGVLAVGSLLAGCSPHKDRVLATTATVIGVQIHQKDVDKTPELKVGYARAELALVPTDKDSKNGDGSAKDSAEVLMEINARGNVALGSAYQGGIYQRLAVGKTAVRQAGAAFMMAKDAEGKLDGDAVKKATEAIKAVPAFNQ